MKQTGSRALPAVLLSAAVLAAALLISFLPRLYYPAPNRDLDSYQALAESLKHTNGLFLPAEENLPQGDVSFQVLQYSRFKLDRVMDGYRIDADMDGDARYTFRCCPRDEPARRDRLLPPINRVRPDMTYLGTELQVSQRADHLKIEFLRGEFWYQFSVQAVAAPLPENAMNTLLTSVYSVLKQPD